mmetsp:Transcript_70597/g.147867  ORF Transcript_70597/g.147867 Transcript_70597/m.147867 type:complete len:549 (-) Transcript_70597:70-1716(-)
MVVLSAAVVTTSKTLLARQFVEMTRLRVEGLIGAFQKLVDAGRDHTFIETETVRYVYQPMESLHLLLVTNRSSNILEDLETLRLLAKIVQDCCQPQVNEEVVLKNALDIVFAFDEVISFGHRESVTLSQVKSYTEMDSHEEKLHQMIEQSKINEAREMANKKQMELKKQRQLDAKNNPGGMPSMTGFGSSDSMGGGGGGGGGGEGGAGSGLSGGSLGGGSGGGSGFGQESMSGGGGGMSLGAMQETPAWNPGMSDDSAATYKPKAGPKKGMTLGKKKPADIFAGMGASDPAPAEEAAPQEEEAPAPVVNPLKEPVKVLVQEKVTGSLEVEGGLNGEAACNGSFEVSVYDHAKADLVCFKLAPQSQEFKYKVHPSLNKASHANSVLEAREGLPAFPTGGCLKWQLKTTSDSFLPITISCWPTATGDGTQMVIELELTDDKVVLENVMISFPASAGSRPSVSSASPGEGSYRDGRVVWHIPVFDKGEGSGTLEFTAAADSASLLPGRFEALQTGTTRCPMEILECYHQTSKDAIDFACEKRVIYELEIGS